MGDHVVQLAGDARLLLADRAPRLLVDRHAPVARGLAERPRPDRERHREDGVLDGGVKKFIAASARRAARPTSETRAAGARRPATPIAKRPAIGRTISGTISWNPSPAARATAITRSGRLRRQRRAAPWTAARISPSEVERPPATPSSSPHDEREEQPDAPRDRVVGESLELPARWAAHAPIVADRSRAHIGPEYEAAVPPPRAPGLVSTAALRGVGVRVAVALRELCCDLVTNSETKSQHAGQARSGPFLRAAFRRSRHARPRSRGGAAQLLSAAITSFE